MVKPVIAETERRKNATFSVAPETPLILKALASAPPFYKEKPQAEGRILDQMLKGAFFANVNALVNTYARAAARIPFSFDGMIWQVDERSVTVRETTSAGIKLHFEEGNNQGEKVVPYDIDVIATSVAGFFNNGFGDDPRMRGFPKDAKVWFYPSSGTRGDGIPVSITFIAGVNIEFLETEADPNGQLPPIGDYAFILLPDGREFRGMVAGASMTDMPNGSKAATIAITALGTKVITSAKAR